MEIKLKETEIVEALKNYVQQKGLPLFGKSVTVSFTASRDKNTGLIAELAIDDIELPDLQADLDFQGTRPGPDLKVVGNDEKANTATVAGPPEVAEVADTAPVDAVCEPEAAKVAPSLFG